MEMQIKINGETHIARAGETILQAVNRAGLQVPTLCHIKSLIPSGACRICSVEVAGYPGLLPSCSYPVQEGMEIETNSARVVTTRKTITELLLANHPDDCLYCVRNNDCRLQDLAVQYGVRERRLKNEFSGHHLDISSPAIEKDPAKCILCGQCVRVCEEIQTVSAIDFINRGCQTVIGTAFEEALNVSSCVNCGQCINVCPTGSLREKSALRRVNEALVDPNKHVVVQHAPAISVSLAEAFNLPPGTDVNPLLVSALRKLGFKRVFDTAFSADLTIMEEASELIHRLQNGGTVPMFTSCSPAWVKFVEQFYPEFLPNVSTCKSPQMMLGAVIKSYYAEQNELAPEDIFSVAIMPCTAKKYEATLPGSMRNGVPDVDEVLTTRELARMFRTYGIDLSKLQPDRADLPFGSRSSAAKLFATSGGVMEAALRSTYKMMTKEELPKNALDGLRGNANRKECKIQVGEIELGVAVANGLGEARRILEEMKQGRTDLHFVEVMSCPSGCIAGGGQLLNISPERIKARQKSLYHIDAQAQLRDSVDNPAVAKLYEEYLGEPLGEKSHELLHTNYVKREVLC
jgi:iron-only hydrogenase group A